MKIMNEKESLKRRTRDERLWNYYYKRETESTEKNGTYKRVR
jgi:hypothetical protein